MQEKELTDNTHEAMCASLKQNNTHLERELIQLRGGDTVSHISELEAEKHLLANVNNELQNQLDRTSERLDHSQAVLKIAQIDQTRLLDENQQMRSRLKTVEEALAKKLISKNGRSLSSTTLDMQLQEEIGILINENLEMREKIEKLEQEMCGKQIKHASQDILMPAVNILEPRGGFMFKLTEDKVPSLVNDLVLMYTKLLTKTNSNITDNVAPAGLGEHHSEMPADILFMCILYADMIGNESLLQG